MAQHSGKLMDTIKRPVTAASSFHQSAAKHLQPLVTLAQKNGISRRCLLTLLTSTAAIPEAGESRKALLQEYVKKSKENKEKNDKERLDDYYKRNYKIISVSSKARLERRKRTSSRSRRKEFSSGLTRTNSY